MKRYPRILFRTGLQPACAPRIGIAGHLVAPMVFNSNICQSSYSGFKKMSALYRLFLSLFLTLLSSYSFAVEFTVTKVIRIGDATWSVSPGVIKFSPSGQLLSFPHGSYMIVSDLEGTIRTEIPLQGRLIQYEWLNDSEIVTIERENLAPPKSLWRMNLLEVPSGQRTTIREYIRLDTSAVQKNLAFEGLTRVNSGRVFTKSVKNNKELEIGAGGALRELSENEQSNRSVPAIEFVWGNDGLYKKSVGGSDSTWVGPRPVSSRVFLTKPVWNLELTYVMHDQYLMRLQDTSIILIDTMLGPPPKGFVICDVDVPIFNPRFHEVAFNLVCYGKPTLESHELDLERDYTALLNLDTWEIVVLDSVLNLEECRAPTFAPNGVALALMSKGQVYIIQRKMK